MAGKGRRASTSNRRGMIAIAGIVAVLLIGLLVQSQELRRTNLLYEEKQADLEQQIKDEEVRAAEIEKLEDYVESTEYIEKVAREKLGLVYPDEIIFRAEE